MTQLQMALTVALTLGLAACGGSGSGGSGASGSGNGGGGGGSTTPTTITLVSDGAIDGVMGTLGNPGPKDGLVVGDDEFGDTQGYRSFVSFGIGAIPSNATIQSAVLRMYQEGAFGSPFPSHGVVLVDHVDFGATREFAEFAGGNIAANIGTLSSDGTVAWKTLDVAARLQADVTAGSSRNQYRFRFSLMDQDNDGQDDYVRFESGEDELGTGNLPELVISYTTP